LLQLAVKVAKPLVCMLQYARPNNRA
jgi:hypothetical protein